MKISRFRKINGKKTSKYRKYQLSRNLSLQELITGEVNSSENSSDLENEWNPPQDVEPFSTPKETNRRQIVEPDSNESEVVETDDLDAEPSIQYQDDEPTFNSTNFQLSSGQNSSYDSDSFHQQSTGQSMNVPPSTEDDFEINDNDEIDEDADADDLDDIPLPDTYEQLIKQLGKLWTESTVKHNISIEGASYLWRLAFKWIGPILMKKEQEQISRKNPQLKHLRRKILKNDVPPVNIRMAFLNLETKEIETTSSPIGPHKAYSDVTKYEKLYEITSVKIKDVLKIHSDSCSKHQNGNNEQVKINFSCDGVADSKSSQVSLDVFSISFPECSTVYPITTIRPTKKSAIDFIQELTIILDELKQENVQIINVLADNPMRALMRMFKNHSSYFACEYCRASAEYYQDPEVMKKLQNAIEESSKKKNNLETEIQTLKDNTVSLFQKKKNKPRLNRLRQQLKSEENEFITLQKKLLSKKVKKCH